MLPSHVRRGIGRKLMRRVSEHYPNVRQFLLITDESDEVANAFYRAIGMTRDLGVLLAPQPALHAVAFTADTPQAGDATAKLLEEILAQLEQAGAPWLAVS